MLGFGPDKISIECMMNRIHDSIIFPESAKGLNCRGIKGIPRRLLSQNPAAGQSCSLFLFASCTNTDEPKAGDQHQVGLWFGNWSQRLEVDTAV